MSEKELHVDNAATYLTQSPKSFIKPDDLLSLTSSKWSITKLHVSLPFLISISKALISTPFSIVHFSCFKSPLALVALRRVLECLPNAMITSPIDSIYAEA
jgi:hypothetical protein